MRYVSTRGRAPVVPLSDTLRAGLAPDGGLYVPAELPKLAIERFDDGSDLAGTAERLLEPFFEEDELRSDLRQIVEEAFDFEAPLRALGEQTYVLELFHGPTAAFKDFGARFLAACMVRLRAESERPLTILVATSGDTGAAVAAAFHRKPGIRVVILYPEDRVSPRQAHQLGCFGHNITTLKVRGSFDDCQRLVKQALGDEDLQARVDLSSANSISLGRLLPQMAYYAHAALAVHRSTGKRLNFAIPTGNLGNGLAALLARAVNIPVGRVTLATNANDVLAVWAATDEYSARESVATVANAMDVGAPSNFERLLWLVAINPDARRWIEAVSVDDESIRSTIRRHHNASDEIYCPHTATAVHVHDLLRESGDTEPLAVVSTAHPAKFESIVEPLCGRNVEIPPALAELLARTSSADSLEPSYAALRRRLLEAR